MGGSPPSDIIIRIDRDVVAMQMRCEIFDTQTGLQVGTTLTYTITALASGATIQAAGITLGAANANGNAAFMRWFNSSVPAHAVPQVGISSPAALGDWEFDPAPGNENDTSGLGQNLSGIGSYVNTPLYVPVCNAGTAQTVKVGQTMNLSGAASYPLDGGATLTYAWTYFAGSDGVNQAPTITGPTTVTPAVTALNLFGSADFQLIVTDGSAQSTTCNIHNGVVYSDGNNVINLTSEGVDAASQKMIGPLIQWGKSAWPWADDRQKYTLDLQIANSANGTYYYPFWRTLASGTVTITGGSANVVGSGTAFQTGGANAICSGTSPRDVDTVLIIRYTGTDSLTHYTPVSVVSCSSDTAAVLSWRSGTGQYPTSANLPAWPYPNCDSGCSGLGWSAGGDFNNWGVWLSGGEPANFYDVVKSARGLYLRSGIDTYETYFETYADVFWEYPLMDQGATYYNGVGSSKQVNSWGPAARIRSTAGVVLRANQQGSGSSKWTGLRVLWNNNEYYENTLAPTYTLTGIDGREEAYRLSELSYCAFSEPDATQKSTCQATILAALVGWITPAYVAHNDMGTAGTWPNLFVGNSSVPALSGTASASVCATNGSPNVVGTNTLFSPSYVTGQPSGGYFVMFSGSPNSTPVNNAAMDALSYSVTAIADATHLTLGSNYQGTTGCGKGYLFADPSGNQVSPGVYGAGWLGWGVQSYALEMLGGAFGWSAQAMDLYANAGAPAAATLYRSYMDAAVQWVRSYGLNPGFGGFYYVSYSIGCIPPISDSTLPGMDCYPSNTDQGGARTLSLDGFRVFSQDYIDPAAPGYHSSAIKTTADLLMNQMFASTGFPCSSPCSSDGYWITGFDNGGGYVTGMPPPGTAQKWTGQFCGWQEACSMWPAARATAAPAAPPASVIGGGVILGPGIP